MIYMENVIKSSPFENFYKKIFLLRDFEDSSLLKVKICKTEAKIKYNRGYSYINNRTKVANTEYIYESIECLGEHDGIIYISENSPLGKWLVGDKISNIYMRLVDGVLTRYELLDCIDL